MFIYRPDKRHEIWRFVLYMVLHAGWFHLGFNVAVQLLFGLPLEMVHGSSRIACIYFSGVLAGSLGTSIFDPEVFLVGASGGVYALLAAHLANVLLNYHQMRYGVIRLAFILIFGKDRTWAFTVEIPLEFYVFSFPFVFLQPPLISVLPSMHATLARMHCRQTWAPVRRPCRM